MVNDVVPYTLDEVEARWTEYERAAMNTDWRKNRRLRRDIADAAFARLVVTCRAFMIGSAVLAGRAVRCTSVSDQDLRCGLDSGHDGSHHALIPDDAFWRKAERKAAHARSGRDT